jgi:putative flippase GtrA
LTAHPALPVRRPLPPVAAQFARVCTVGLSNTAITLAAFWALERLGLPYPGASALAFLAGVANGFALNSRWTFRAHGSFPRYFGVQLLGLGLGVGLVVIIVSALHAPHLAAQVGAIPPVSVLTFTLSRRLAYGH